MQEEWIILTKTERQLLLYLYFRSPVIKGRLRSEKLYGIPVSTIYKDMRDLTDAGMINLKWKPGNEVTDGKYIENDCDHIYDESKDRPTRVRHLRKLRRLCMLFDLLWNEPLEVDGVKARLVRGKTCKEYYKELYPEVSDRTMQRDFQTMTRLGFPVRYNRRLQYYEFYEILDEDDWRVYGVSYDEESKKLKRLTGSEYDLQTQSTCDEDLAALMEPYEEDI